MTLSTANASFVDIPQPPRPIVDQADVFTAQEEAELAGLAVSLRAAPGPELVVWTLPSLRGEPIESLGIRAAETWQLGHRERDDGLILLVAARERRMRIEVGQGLEGDVPDVLAYRQIQEILVPGFRLGQPAKAVARWMSDVGRRTTPGWSPGQSALENLDQGSGHASSAWLFMGLVLAVILLRSLPSMLGLRSSWAGGAPWGRGYGRSGRPGGFGGYGGFGGSGGGGGWGGSGGGFGGGGSSGGW